jgi:heme A synthase
MTRFSKYAWGVLAYNIIVILWGAYVRASGSGAGCGSHWPLCNGEVIPRAPQSETIVEFTHRLMSGVALLLVVGLVIWAWKEFPSRHAVRLGAGFSMFFMLTEALVGAGLVLFQLVAENSSIVRAFSISIHLLNTFLLLACLSLTAWWSEDGQLLVTRKIGALGWMLGIGLVGVLVLGMSGAVTALGDTLFPASSFSEGFREELSPTAHVLVRIRILHPTIAVLVSVYLILVLAWVCAVRPNPINNKIRRVLALLIAIQIFAGVVNVFLLAPIWLQIVHLLLSDAIWILLVIFSANALSEHSRSVPTPERTKFPVKSSSTV